jgi:hypothetical protein
MAYCATSDILGYQGFPSTTVATDIVAVAAIIPRAQAVIDAYTGRTFEETSSDGTARKFDISDVLADGVTLLLDKDLCSITSVTAGSDTVASTNYTTQPRNETPYWAIRLKDNSTNSWDLETSDGDWENAIVVTGKWAYSSSAPADIQHACIRLVAWMYKQRETEADLDRPLLTGDGITILPSRLPADVVEILNRYRRAKVA